MKEMIKANLNPKYEIQKGAANRFHVLVVHSIKVPGQRRYVEAPDVIMMQTLQEFDQFEKHKPKTIVQSELIHDPRIKQRVEPNDDIATGQTEASKGDDMAAPQKRHRGPNKKKQ